MRFTRWLNPMLPQTLQIATFLLYLNAVFSFFSLIGLGIGGSAYNLVPWALGLSPFDDGFDALQAVSVLGGALAYGFAGLAIANGQRLGWKIGLGVAIGALVLPALVFFRDDVDLGGTYVLTLIFDVALVALLAHPMSRDYQKVWFE